MRDSKTIETQMQIEIDLFCARCGSGMKGCIEDVYSKRTIRINVDPCRPCIEDEIDEMRSARDDR